MPLDYAPQSTPPWHRRKPFRRTLLALAAACLLAVLLVAGPRAVDIAGDALTMRRNRAIVQECLTYRAPPEQVVFDFTGGAARTVVPAAPWVRWMSFGGHPTVFLHGRRDLSPSADPFGRLVAVQIDSQLRHTYDGRTVLDRPVLSFESFQVERWVGPGRYASQVHASTKLVLLPQPGDTIRVFAGQPHPVDPGRFSFDVEYNGVRQTVRGSLTGGAVVLTPPDGTVPAAPGWQPATFWVPRGASPQQRSISEAVAQSAGQKAPPMWPATPYGQPATTSSSPPPAPAAP